MLGQTSSSPVIPYQCVPTKTRKRLHILYLVAGAFALVVGITGMLRVRNEVGQPFGGFAWGWDFATHSLTVIVETPEHWPGPQHGLRGLDHILAIDGRDPRGFGAVYQAGTEGEEITYLIARDGQQFNVQVPLSVFTMEQLYEIYGFFFLTGISCLLAGYFLVRDTRDRATFLSNRSLPPSAVRTNDLLDKQNDCTIKVCD